MEIVSGTIGDSKIANPLDIAITDRFVNQRPALEALNFRRGLTSSQTANTAKMTKKTNSLVTILPSICPAPAACLYCSVDIYSMQH
jgi:hypothetical protein